MVNESVILSLQAQPVPADQECRIESLSQILQGAEQYLRVTGLASTIASGGGGFTPVTNNVGQQALNRVIAVEEKVADLQSNQRERRVAANRKDLIAGTSVVPLSWSPAMPSADYEVRVTVYGPSDAPTSAFAHRIVSGTQTTTGVNLVFTGIPANSFYTAVIESLE